MNCSGDVYTEHGWSVPKAVRDWEEREAAVRGEEEGGEGGEGEEEGAEREGRDYNYTSPLLSKLYHAWYHVWPKDGAHMGWLDVKGWTDKVLSDLGRDVSQATAYRYLSREKELYIVERGFGPAQTWHCCSPL